MGRFFRFRVLVDAGTRGHGETALQEGFPPQATALASLRASPEGGRGERFRNEKIGFFRLNMRNLPLKEGAGEAEGEITNTHLQFPITSNPHSPREWGLYHVRLITYHKNFSASPRLPISASAQS
ncbi:MAG: hypothetical protein KME21_20685 [Desmonostoc vinosum HA7617-LM4]|jgi:hypothetical protein|nr:hypothetical protein [Desmonostoc vinosum HA7617-LM4]